MSRTLEVVGLIPAAGVATRLAPLPCSKEILPVGFHERDGSEVPRPKAACDYLLASMRHAGVRKVYLVLREGKWDIAAYLGDGNKMGMRVAYLMMDLADGVPFTLDQAYDFVRECRVVCGFPDILTQPEDVFSPLLRRLDETGAAVALALFPAHDPRLMDQVRVDGDGRVRFVQVKPGPERLDSGWVAAAWTPAFTDLLHDYVTRATQRIHQGSRLAKEPHLGDVVQAAVESGLAVQSVSFPTGSFIDIGSPDRLVEAWNRLLRPAPSDPSPAEEEPAG